MKQGVRTAVLIVDAGRVLLVREIDPRTGQEYWVPPGGAVEEGDPTVFTGAQREVLEEAGLGVEIGRLIYLREFRESLRDTRWLELYFLANTHRSVQRSRLAEVSSELRRETRWFTRRELEDVVVYPDVLRTDFWEHVLEENGAVRYLGNDAG